MLHSLIQHVHWGYLLGRYDEEFSEVLFSLQLFHMATPNHIQ